MCYFGTLPESKEKFKNQKKIHFISHAKLMHTAQWRVTRTFALTPVSCVSTESYPDSEAYLISRLGTLIYIVIVILNYWQNSELKETKVSSNLPNQDEFIVWFKWKFLTVPKFFTHSHTVRNKNKYLLNRNTSFYLKFCV